MAFRSLVQKRAAVPLVASVFAASTLLYSIDTLYAEAPTDQFSPRKPIYNDFQLSRPQQNQSPTSNPAGSPSPTPTDRLAAQIRQARLYIHAYTTATEDRLNAFMSSVLVHEQSFTQTIASLAPPAEAHEPLFPGSLYILVAAMAGSIISRNRNLVLRAGVPAAVGLGAAWIVLPITMRNIGDLVWTYEEKVPILSMNHLRIRGALEEGSKQFRAHADATRKWSDAKVKEGRETIEGWVKKGR